MRKIYTRANLLLFNVYFCLKCAIVPKNYEIVEKYDSRLLRVLVAPYGYIGYDMSFPKADGKSYKKLVMQFLVYKRRRKKETSDRNKLCRLE